MPDLFASVIHLTALEDGTLLSVGGQYGHAAFLSLMQAVDPALSTWLHNANQRKPFTVSTVGGLPAPMRPRDSAAAVPVQAGQTCQLRLTLLDPRLFHLVIDRLLFGPSRPTLQLGEISFLVTEVYTTPGSHPWAGCAELSDLQARLDEPAPRIIAFELASPTAFGLGDQRISTLPTADLLFANLARAWQLLTGQDTVSAIIRYCQEKLAPGTFNLQTWAFRLKNKAQLGAVGQIEYVLMDESDAPLARALNLLADLAFYCGIGRKTTQGMGQARRIPRVYLEGN
ncbi:MAG: CRISPR system precrRNA processing endoribonuclease RAMP protein Cas6 [Chloroflexi bacterium]|nr:CRISPR system precrRNA processing endoribonuclease RAMP protein Cas6 [Chloroflexota bacterium]